ncbi:hypothetical protein D9757_004452 [Collybiopsis confluens]|uniref:MYND-type domain-containing protein n=1 Tax=Collybiopsis confluens TaxID=2823264 RepID=A0A8H5HWQ4_9AGAR|nr:hypothetical protein D9757_004452 [Collybiopsis confluens]
MAKHFPIPMSPSQASHSYCRMCKRQADTGESWPRCTKCKTVAYCSKECQIAHWPVHKPICTPRNPEKIWAIRILNNNGRYRQGIEPAHYFRHEVVSPAIFRYGELCPVTKHIGIPLIICRDMSRGFPSSNNMNAENIGSNEIAVKLRIEDTANALAPMDWQLDVPECVVMREDREPLTMQLLETIYSFNKYLLSYPIIDKGWAPWQGLLNPSVWQYYAMKYYEEQKAEGRPGFSYFLPPSIVEA